MKTLEQIQKEITKLQEQLTRIQSGNTGRDEGFLVWIRLFDKYIDKRLNDYGYESKSKEMVYAKNAIKFATRLKYFGIKFVFGSETKVPHNKKEYDRLMEIVDSIVPPKDTSSDPSAYGG